MNLENNNSTTSTTTTPTTETKIAAQTAQANTAYGSQKKPTEKKPPENKPPVQPKKQRPQSNLPIVKIGIIVGLIVVALLVFNAFKRPFDRPEIITIMSNETAFLVPVVGNSDNQKKFLNEDDMQRQLVTEKDIRIPHYWLQTGRLPSQGEWRAKSRLLIIDRTPETREWVNGPAGTNSGADEAIKVEAKDSITFYSGMNCTAMIKESDAVAYRYNYGERQLAAIMDTEIRPMVEALYAEIAGTMNYEGVISNKDSIISYIRTGRGDLDATNAISATYDDKGNELTPYVPAKPAQTAVTGVLAYFKERGITISVLGMKGGLVPENAEIQKSIDEKFKAEKEYQTQQAINKRNVEQSQAEAEAKLGAQKSLNQMKIEQAEADAKSVKIKASVLADELKLKEMEVMLIQAEAELERARNWNGAYPQTLVTDSENANMFLGLPGLTEGQQSTN